MQDLTTTTELTTMTVREFIDNGTPEGCSAFLPTAWGEQFVSYIKFPDGGPWAYCPKDNGGFGMSYAIHYGTMLVVRGEK